MAKKRKFKKKARSLNDRTNQISLNRTAPYIILTISATIFFCIGWLFTSKKTFIEKTNLEITRAKPIPIYIPKANTIYVFEVEQSLSNQVPTYSELEIEILDKDFIHLYTVYEDLWKEKHDNGDGGMSIYSDQILELELELEEEGVYYIKATSYNNNNTRVTLKLYDKKGSLYFKAFMYIFGILSIILLYYAIEIIGKEELLTGIRKAELSNPFSLTLLIVILIFISCIVISLTHYGYPSIGDEIRLPSWFFSTNDVIYLG